MSSLFSGNAASDMSVLVNPFSYHEVCLAGERNGMTLPATTQEIKVEGSDQVGLSPAELEQLLFSARLEASEDAERRLRHEMEDRLTQERRRVGEAVDAFTAERRQYFAQVESEVIHLSLAIAAKILHREAQADPMLIAAMVRIALDKLQDSSSVSIHVPANEVERWQRSMVADAQGVAAQIVGDAQMAADECLLRTNLGEVKFSIDAQLKEVEQGFFDLLAKRPASV